LRNSRQPAAKVFREKITGTTAERPQLRKLITQQLVACWPPSGC
jgi:hypothetical protein